MEIGQVKHSAHGRTEDALGPGDLVVHQQVTQRSALVQAQKK